MSFFDLVHPKHRQASLERHRRKMGDEAMPGLFEMSIIRKDGTEVPIELTSAYTTYQGRTANVAFIRDITERKQAEEREKKLQQEIYLSGRLASIGELAAGVAHEINNPLTGIIGFSERLLRRSTEEGARQHLEIIRDEAQRAAKVVENLLTFARRREPKREPADINEILGRTLELRAYELRTSNIEVVTDLTPGLPKTMVDFQQIQEVFLNIILNAEQAITGANRGGKLSIKTQETKGYVRISFVDDGPGIPAEYLDKLFDPFFTMRAEGTGLGLSACHGIVTGHGGRIYVRSEPGKGATFVVELPVTTEEIDSSKIAEE
jgi:signal transduction histidine kinase